MADKYSAPTGPPPNYPNEYPQPQVNDVAPGSNYGDPRALGGYGSPAPPQPVYGGYGPPQGGYYQQGPPPGQPGPYGYPQQQPMYYQQGPPPQGYYRQSSGAEGMCAGILGALACCCCVDMLI